jgi:hypothetical protein
MTDTVRCADGKRCVEQTTEEANGIVPAASLVVVCPPDLPVARPTATRHHSQDHNGDEHTAHGQNQGNAVEERQVAVAHAHDTTAHPENNLEDDKRLPAVPFDFRVAQEIHSDSLVAENRAHGRGGEQPRARIQVACEESSGTAMSTCDDSGPVVDTSSGGDGRGQFGQ